MNDDHSNSRWQDGAWVPAIGDEGRGSAEYPPLPIDRSVLVAAAETGDVEQAVKLGQEYVNKTFDANNGDRVAELKAEAEQVRKQLIVSQAALDDTDKTLAGEPLQIPAPQENGGVEGPINPYAEVSPRDWQLRDKLTGGAALVATIALMFASYFGIQATFADAELPIFERNPHLSYLLAALIPAAGLMIKLIGNTFSDPANRDRYRKGVALTGGISVLLWVVIFSGLFEGLSGVFDPFAEPNHLLGWAFNSVHIIAEIFIAAGLFAQTEAVMLKTSPSIKIDNPARPPLERFQCKQVETVEAQTARLGRINGQLVRLYGLRDSTQVLVETAIRQRMNEKPRDGLL